MHILQRPIYSNIPVLGPDGTHLSFTSLRRAQQMGTSDPRSSFDGTAVRLAFWPPQFVRNTEQERNYQSQPIPHRCVRCGAGQGITRHHLVPQRYHDCLPRYLKSKNQHDVLPLCLECHNHCESHTAPLDAVLLPLLERTLPGFQRDIPETKYRKTLYHSWNQLPEAVQLRMMALAKVQSYDELRQHIETIQGGRTFQRLRQYPELPPKVAESFIRHCREFFLQFQPKFLPYGWSTTYRFRHETT